MSVETINVLAELRNIEQGMGQAVNRLYEASLEFEGHIDTDTGEFTEGIDAQYQRVVDNFLIELHEKAMATGQRAPAQDIREAMARTHVKQEEPLLTAKHQSLSVEIQALRSWISGRKEQIRAKQSILKGERE